MMTEGVMVLRAAVMKLKVACIVDGNAETACINVVYEAIIIGGKGGKSAGCGGGGGSMG